MLDNLNLAAAWTTTGLYENINSSKLKRKMAGRKKHIKRSRVHKSLLHNSHSGRFIHHKHTHYPTVVFFLLLCGVFLAGSTAITRAATLQVKATVLGVPPPYAAQITSPADGARFKEIPVEIQGTCPSDSIVRIYRNGLFSGSAICAVDNTFSLMSDLFEGKNTLVPKVFNYANVEGPEGDPIDVYYDKPVSAPPFTPETPASTPDTPGGSITQLFLDSDTKFRTFHTNQAIRWPAEIGGGLAPYAVSIHWGDESSDILSLKKAGKFNIVHVYSEPGEYRGTYKVILRASDSQGAKAYLQLVLVVNDIKAAAQTSFGLDGEGTFSYLSGIYNKILLMWPFYAVAVLMAASFWLGERREINMTSRNRRGRRAH